MPVLAEEDQGLVLPTAAAEPEPLQGLLGRIWKRSAVVCPASRFQWLSVDLGRQSGGHQADARFS
ncbi:hypothetical protein [Mycolicibacterium peregrinum]|uniref:hypothetical protein n=1 Tax=Mycolicibacterium peregrinum TaxID=43304 RepID=UPI003AAD02EE